MVEQRKPLFIIYIIVALITTAISLVITLLPVCYLTSYIWMSQNGEQNGAFSCKIISDQVSVYNYVETPYEGSEEDYTCKCYIINGYLFDEKSVTIPDGQDAMQYLQNNFDSVKDYGRKINPFTMQVHTQEDVDTYKYSNLTAYNYASIIIVGLCVIAGVSGYVLFTVDLVKFIRNRKQLKELNLI